MLLMMVFKCLIQTLAHPLNISVILRGSVPLATRYISKTILTIFNLCQKLGDENTTLVTTLRILLNCTKIYSSFLDIFLHLGSSLTLKLGDYLMFTPHQRLSQVPEGFF